MHGAHTPNHTLGITQPMPLVRHVQHTLRLRQLRPIQLQRIERPVAIVGAQQDHLRPRQLLPVAERIDHRQQLLPTLGLQSRRQVQRRVIANLLRHLAPGLALMIHLRAHVQDIDHHRGNGHHALVDRRSQPRSPAALRRARHSEGIDRCTPALLHDALHRIHRTHRALHHRQQQRPILLAGLQVLIERVSDQRIFGSIEHRCERHLAQHADRRVDRFGETSEQQRFARQLSPAALAVILRLPAPAVHEQQRMALVARHVRRPQYEQLMLPLDAAPRLRRQDVLDVVRRADFAGIDLVPREAFVGARDIARERIRGRIRARRRQGKRASERSAQDDGAREDSYLRHRKTSETCPSGGHRSGTTAAAT